MLTLFLFSDSREGGIHRSNSSFVPVAFKDTSGMTVSLILQIVMHFKWLSFELLYLSTVRNAECFGFVLSSHAYKKMLTYARKSVCLLCLGKRVACFYTDICVFN